MIQVANMLILGAAGRNAGKTEFACKLIQHYNSTCQVVGVKITTVKERDGQCPRGGKGCGVCSSLQGNFCLTEETNVGNDKDTARMKAAGAHRVLWLRVLREHLLEGIRELLKLIPPDACVVCESNSARLVLEPGAFLVIREKNSTTTKESCAAVLEYADRELLFFGDGWNFSPEQCNFTQGRWSVPMAATGAVLAGGQSGRMGRDKSLLPIHGRTMLEHILGQIRPITDELIIGANDATRYAFTGIPVIEDQVPGQGPLMGILSCLQASHHERVFVTACDIPDLPENFVRMMLRRAMTADLVMPRNSEGQEEPLMAVYRKNLIPAARAALAQGKRRIVALFEEPGVRVAFVNMPPGDWYQNLNTPADYEKILKS